MMIRVLAVAMACGLLASALAAGMEPKAAASEPATTPAGPKADVVVRLWEGNAPNFVAGGKSEEFVNQRYRNVSVPEMMVYLPKKEKAKGTALIICAGGAYTHLAMCFGVDPVVKLLNDEGIAVFGLKYRTKYGDNDVVADALADGQRAVRMVRSRAEEWGVNPKRIGVQGYSAGSNLALNLLGHLDEGDAKAADVVERASSRPDFVLLMCPWPNKKAIEDFPIGKDAPPTFVASAKDDKSAPFAFAVAIDEKLKQAGVAEQFWGVEKGGHAAFHYGEETGEGSKWPVPVLAWLGKLGML